MNLVIYGSPNIKVTPHLDVGLTISLAHFCGELPRSGRSRHSHISQIVLIKNNSLNEWAFAAAKYFELPFNVVDKFNIDDADTLFLTWDGTNKTCKSMLNQMQKLNKPVYHILYIHEDNIDIPNKTSGSEKADFIIINEEPINEN
jgi:hypothetical protein